MAVTIVDVAERVKETGCSCMDAYRQIESEQLELEKENPNE